MKVDLNILLMTIIRKLIILSVIPMMIITIPLSNFQTLLKKGVWISMNMTNTLNLWLLKNDSSNKKTKPYQRIKCLKTSIGSKQLNPSSSQSNSRTKNNSFKLIQVHLLHELLSNNNPKPLYSNSNPMTYPTLK